MPLTVLTLVLTPNYKYLDLNMGCTAFWEPRRIHFHLVPLSKCERSRRL